MDKYTDGSAPIDQGGFGLQRIITKEIDCPHCYNRITLSNSDVAITTCSRCKKQIRLKYEPSESKQHKIQKQVGNKIAIGFVILLIIWGLEVFAEDGKLAKMESIQRGEISESEHLSCQQGESFDMEICLDEMQQDAIDDQRVVVWIAIFEIIAWFIVFLGLLEIAQKINQNQ